MSWKDFFQLKFAPMWLDMEKASMSWEDFFKLKFAAVVSIPLVNKKDGNRWCLERYGCSYADVLFKSGGWYFGNPKSPWDYGDSGDRRIYGFASERDAVEFKLRFG